jgi:cytochrome c oxidase assembly factor CtaG
VGHGAGPAVPSGAAPAVRGRTIAFFAASLVIAFATESGIGTCDDTLFWDHLIRYLMLIVIAPPLLGAGQPVTLLMHARSGR